MINDIKMASGTKNGYVTYNNLVIKKSSNQIKPLYLNFRLILICIENLVFGEEEEEDENDNENDDDDEEIRLKQMKISIILFNLYQKLTNQFS